MLGCRYDDTRQFHSFNFSPFCPSHFYLLSSLPYFWPRINFSWHHRRWYWNSFLSSLHPCRWSKLLISEIYHAWLPLRWHTTVSLIQFLSLLSLPFLSPLLLSLPYFWPRINFSGTIGNGTKILYVKVRTFWEGHKIWKNLPPKIWHYWVKFEKIFHLKFDITE